MGNIGAGKSSLVKLLAFSTGMNALFELPYEGFEGHIALDIQHAYLDLRKRQLQAVPHFQASTCIDGSTPHRRVRGD